MVQLRPVIMSGANIILVATKVSTNKVSYNFRFCAAKTFFRFFILFLSTNIGRRMENFLGHVDGLMLEPLGLSVGAAAGEGRAGRPQEP